MPIYGIGIQRLMYGNKPIGRTTTGRSNVFLRLLFLFIRKIQ